jgi:hypothetical protein
MLELTQAEQVLVANIYDQDVQSVLSDIRHCNYAQIKVEFTKQQVRMMKQVMQLPVPPPKKPWEQRQRRHYSMEEVLNEMCGRMEMAPCLCSCVVDRIITKFHLANQIPPVPPQIED